MSASQDVQAGFATTLVDEWVRAGVSDAVVSPGSRSTPLLAALDSDGRIAVHVVLDERSAAFVALGLGLASGRPAPVITTSGTAAVELHPALVEAHHAQVPMIAVTADRPQRLQGVGAPQTIEQDHLYSAISRWSCSPGVPDEAGRATWRSLGARSVIAALGQAKAPGPVHLNLAFDEPLLGDPSQATSPPGRPGGQPWHRFVPSGPSLPDASLVDHLVGFAGRRGLVVAGAGAGDPELVIELGRTLGWPVLADPRSGARRGESGVVAAGDALLRVDPVRSWLPEIVLRLGAPSASKVLATWLEALPADIDQILVDPRTTWGDPGRRVGIVTETALAGLAPAVLSSPALSAVTSPSRWWEAWTEAESRAQAAIDAALLEIGGDGLGEAGLARRLYALLGSDAVLVTSSSMPVRDVEWFGAGRALLRTVSNRGANGIDGVVATTIGVALAGSATVALIGDLAFAYDVSSLLWAAERNIDCTFIVVDNDGGGIFSFLPQATLPGGQFERLWGTPHGVDLLGLAAAYGASCSEITSAEDLAALTGGVGANRGVRVARYRSDRAANVVAHRLINESVAAAVADIVV